MWNFTTKRNLKPVWVHFGSHVNVLIECTTRRWLNTNKNSMLNWFLHTECHFIKTTNNYIQTLRTKTCELKQGNRLFNKQDKIWICWRQVTFIRNWISVTLIKSTLVSEFNNYVDFASTKRYLWQFQDKSSCCQVIWHTADVQKGIKRSKLRTDENGWEWVRLV